MNSKEAKKEKEKEEEKIGKYFQIMHVKMFIFKMLSQ